MRTERKRVADKSPLRIWDIKRLWDISTRLYGLFLLSSRHALNGYSNNRIIFSLYSCYMYIIHLLLIAHHIHITSVNFFPENRMLSYVTENVDQGFRRGKLLLEGFCRESFCQGGFRRRSNENTFLFALIQNALVSRYCYLVTLLQPQSIYREFNRRSQHILLQ